MSAFPFTCVLSLSGLTTAVAAVALLAVDPVYGSGNSSPPAAKSHASPEGGYRPDPVVRDHRKNPRPWSPPPHSHRHDNRR